VDFSGGRVASSGTDSSGSSRSPRVDSSTTMLFTEGTLRSGTRRRSPPSRRGRGQSWFAHHSERLDRSLDESSDGPGTADAHRSWYPTLISHDWGVMVDIRTAILSDMESLRAIFCRASLSNEGDRGFLLTHPESLAFSDKGVREGRTRVAVAPDSGEVVGFASWLVKDNVIELDDLFVDPIYMRRGIGWKLVLDILGTAKEQGFDRLEVTANPHAKEFYKTVGFAPGRMVKTEFYPGQRMQLDIH
jgi:ribosomal protein S18 acetylase RimI-like enzyme